MATRFGIDHDGRRLEVEPEGGWTGTRVRLFADGEPAGEVVTRGGRARLERDGFTIEARLAWHGNSIVSAELRAPGRDAVALEPEPGSAAARRERFARAHPGLYAARHVAKAVGKAVGPLLGIGLLIGLLPAISLPLPDLPAVPLPDLPSIPWPALDLPELRAPAWLLAFLATAKIWVPILVALAVAAREYRRRRRRGRGAGQEPSASRLSAASRPSHSDARSDIQRTVASSPSGRTR